jgi:hypothetical protein
LFHEIGTAVLLIILTLWLQSAGLAALIFWVRRAVAGDLRRLGPFRSTALVVQLTAAVIVLHGVLILFWAACYRWLCLPSWESALYFSASSYATGTGAHFASDGSKPRDFRISSTLAFSREQKFTACTSTPYLFRPGNVMHAKTIITSSSTTKIMCVRWAPGTASSTRHSVHSW